MASDEPYRALLAVSEAIVSHRELSALFHELAGRLHEVVRFDYLALVLHEAASHTMRLHILEACEPAPRPWVEFPIGELPEGLVWQTQQPLILTDVAEETRWPRFMEQVRPYGGRRLRASPDHGSAAAGDASARVQAAVRLRCG